MARIELELSDDVYAQWRAFMHTQSAGRLVEAGLLGDWMCLAFIAEVPRYIKEGIPRAQAPTEKEEQEMAAAMARRRLSKPQKRVLPMFDMNDQITVPEIARTLGLSEEEAARMVEGWQAEGFLAAGPTRAEAQTYVLSQTWNEYNLMANRPSLNAPRQPMMLGKLPTKGKELK
jgi:hypothetical protein